MHRNVGYDPRKDFAPIGLIAAAPALLVHPSLPVRNVMDLIALMKNANPPFREGAAPMPTSPEEHAAIINREETKWSAIVKASGAKAD